MRNMKNAPKTITSALKELGAELGISEADFGGKVNIEGQDPIIGSRHHLGDSTSVLLSLFGMEMAAIWKERTGITQDITVNARNAVCNLSSFLYARQNGVVVDFDDEGNVQVCDFFKCKDGRWVFIVPSLPRLRQIACDVLNCPSTKKAFAEKFLQWNALDIEEAMYKAGVPCVMVRSRDEWIASEQAKYTLAEPLISITKIGESEPIPFTANPELPLSGIKVLDNSQIFAAPLCARYAADAGADVLHLLTPYMPNPPRVDSDLLAGKRSAWCDVNVPSMKEQFLNLLKDADVWNNNTSLRFKKGFSAEEMAKIKPGLICVEVSCYGFSGPWAERGGFEQIGQAVTGFNVAEGSADAPINPATYLLNDVQCGVEAIIGMSEALRRRAKEGGSYLVRVSLARNCHWMQDFGTFADSEIAHLPKKMLSSLGLHGQIVSEFDIPLANANGSLGEIQVMAAQVEYSSGMKIQPRNSGEANGSSKLDWSVFSKKWKLV